MDGMMSEGDQIWAVRVTFWSLLSVDKPSNWVLLQAATCLAISECT